MAISPALKQIMFALQEISYFLVWWYSQGLIKFLLRIKNFLIDEEKKLGLRIWIKNIFTPMYGQKDWTSRVISFFMRLFQIIIRTLLLIFWIFISLILFIIWLGIPLLVIYQIIFQLFL